MPNPPPRICQLPIIVHQGGGGPNDTLPVPQLVVDRPNVSICSCYEMMFGMVVSDPESSISQLFSLLFGSYILSALSSIMFQEP